MAEPNATDKSASSDLSSPPADSGPIPLIVPAALIAPVAAQSATASPLATASQVASPAAGETAAPITTAAPRASAPNSTFPRDSRVRPLKLLLLLTVFAITGVGSLMLLASSMRPGDAVSPTSAGQAPSTSSGQGPSTSSGQSRAKVAHAVAPVSAAVEPVESQESVFKTKWTASANSRKAGYGANVVFELPADGDVEVWRKHVRPVLTMRCAAKATEVFVVTMSPAMPEGKSNQHTIKVSFDGGEPVEQAWEHSIDHDALFSQNGAAMMRQIARAERMTFSWAPFNAPPATVTFDVDGFATLQKTAASKCRS
jgi:hypothetical protein